MTAEEKNPIEQALDVFVYAPIGFALSARKWLPQLAEEGRQRLQQQTMVAKMLGQMAVNQGKVEVEKRLQAYVEGGQPKPANQAPAPPAATAAPTEPAEAAEVEPESDELPLTTHEQGGNGQFDDGHLAIPGYDALSASQVVQRLEGLDGTELDAVRAYEESTRGRKTILAKIDQLQTG
jgi:hypothetical protein